LTTLSNEQENGIPSDLPELRFEYQPTDEDNRPIGGKQVIKYRTQDELNHKLVKQNTELIRKLRTETRNNRLGILDQQSIDERAPRNVAGVQFNPRTLSASERLELSQQLLDPETFDKATQTIVEASYGISGEGLRTVISDLQGKVDNVQAQREVDIFKRRNPEYVICPENMQAIIGWMDRYNLAPVAENFEKAYLFLLDQGVLVTSLEVVELPVSPVTPPSNVVGFTEQPPADPNEYVEPARVVETLPIENQLPVERVAPTEHPALATEPPVAAKPVASRVPTGLNNGNSRSEGVSAPVGSDIVYEFKQYDEKGNQVGPTRTFTGMRAIDAMPPDEYKRRLLSEKGFAAKVEKLMKKG